MAQNNQADQLEAKLADVFIDKAPPLPEGGKQLIVNWSPWVALIVSIITLLSTLSLWHWAHEATTLINYANNQVCNFQAGSGPLCSSRADRLSVWVWLAVIFGLIEGVLYLAAYKGLRDRRKQGWNYMYYALLVNVAYAIITLFTSYDVVGHFIGAIIGSAIGFYLLFQVRSHYSTLGVVTGEPVHHSDKDSHDPTAQ